MADYTIPNLTTAVVGFASTAAFNGEFISDSIVTQNLIFHLDSSLSNSYSGIGSSWNDLTANANNATLIGNYSYYDYSLTFANGGYATIPDKSSFDISGDFAFESFIYMTNTPNSLYPSAIVSSWAGTGSINNKFILFVDSSGFLNFQVNGESNSIVHPDTINLNEWYHVAVSRINGVVEIYINGVKGNSLTYPSSISPTLDIEIGSYSASSGFSFQGKIPLVRFYNGRGLTENEVFTNSRTIQIDPTNGTVSVGNLDFSSFDETRPGWLTGRRPVDGQVFPRGVYNK